MSDIEPIGNAEGALDEREGCHGKEDALLGARILDSNRRFTRQVMQFASLLSQVEPRYSFSRFLQQNASTGAQAWAANPAFPTEPDTAAWVVEVVNAILAEHHLGGSRRHILVRLTDPCGHTLQWTTGLGGRVLLIGEIFDELSKHHSKIADCLQDHLKASEACYQKRIERMKRRLCEVHWSDFRLGLWEQLGCFVSMELVDEEALPEDLRIKASERKTLSAPCMIVPDPDWERQLGLGRRRRSKSGSDASEHAELDIVGAFTGLFEPQFAAV